MLFEPFGRVAARQDQRRFTLTTESIQETLVVSYIDAGRKIAQEIGVDVLDIYSEIDRDKYDAFIADDGMHFNAAGHAYIAERIWSVLFA